MKQSTIWLRSEGDKFYRRNMRKVRHPDPVQKAISAAKLRPQTILEIGCGDGWRLKDLRRDLGAVCYGIDASKEAIIDAPDSVERFGIKCWKGTADSLIGVRDRSIDMVIYGFVLYQVDREDLFKVAYEADRVLRDTGTIVIHDFYSERAYCRKYQHDDALMTFKMDHSKLWLGHPAYRCIARKITGTTADMPVSRDDQVTVMILRKDLKSGFPLEGEWLS